MFCKCFSSFHKLPFHYFDYFLCVHKLFSLMYISICLFFTFVACVFPVIPMISLPRTMSWSSPPCFFLAVLQFQTLSLSLVCFKLIFYKIKSQFHSFACWHPIFSTFLNRLSLPHCGFLALLSNISWHICMDLFLESESTCQCKRREFDP